MRRSGDERRGNPRGRRPTRFQERQGSLAPGVFLCLLLSAPSGVCQSVWPDGVLLASRGAGPSRATGANEAAPVAPIVNLWRLAGCQRSAFQDPFGAATIPAPDSCSFPFFLRICYTYRIASQAGEIMGKPVLVIRYDNHASPVRKCALCGRRVETTASVKLCLKDSLLPVCWDCGRTYAADMVGMASLYLRAATVDSSDLFEDLSPGSEPDPLAALRRSAICDD